jgi:hypothetical protein
MTTSILALPDLAYDHLQDPAEAHRLIGEARRVSPIAMGPHGPEVLTYDLVRSALRDDRFAMPKGITLAGQGITSGPLWDRTIKGLLSLDGAEHTGYAGWCARHSPRSRRRGCAPRVST